MLHVTYMLHVACYVCMQAYMAHVHITCERMHTHGLRAGCMGGGVCVRAGHYCPEVNVPTMPSETEAAECHLTPTAKLEAASGNGFWSSGNAIRI